MVGTGKIVDVRGDAALSQRIDFLRLFAILMVIFHHMGPFLELDFEQSNPALQKPAFLFLTFITRE